MSLPTYIDFAFDGLKIRAIHGSPQSFFDYIYPDTPDDVIAPWLADLTCDYLLASHTHVPMIRKLSKLAILNPGSAGQPRDGDWRASYMIFDTATHELENARLEYDIDKTCDRIRRSMPHADELIAILKRGY